MAEKVRPGPVRWSGAQSPASAELGAEDARLVAGTAAGDADAFRTLVAKHLASGVAIARRVLRDDAEAEDVAQEAFLRLWRNAATLEVGPSGIKPWLRRVISNLCIDRLRSSRNTTVTDQIPEVADPAIQERGLEERDLAKRVDLALKTLPERQRLALTLFHYEGMSQVEVGRALGVSDEAIESLLARARRTLKAALADEWRALLPDATD